MRLSLTFSALLFAVSTTPCFAQTHGWHAAFDEARTAAESGAQPVLIHFHAWYCGPCQRMDREVFADLQVQQALRTGLAAVKVDVTHEPELAARCGATSVPRDVEMENIRLEADTTLRWKRNPEPDVAGYRIVWRQAWASDWRTVNLPSTGFMSPPW